MLQYEKIRVDPSVKTLFCRGSTFVEVLPLNILHDWQHRLNIPFGKGFHVDVFFIDVLNIAKMLAFHVLVFFGASS